MENMRVVLPISASYHVAFQVIIFMYLIRVVHLIHVVHLRHIRVMSNKNAHSIVHRPLRPCTAIYYKTTHTFLKDLALCCRAHNHVLMRIRVYIDRKSVV